MAKAYKIETERLIIRCFRVADAVMVKKAIDNSLENLRPWMPWTKFEPETLDEKVERLRNFRTQFDLDEDYAFGVFNKIETELIGSTGLHTRIGPDAREIGYWINTAYLRQGYATETVSALVKVGFEVEELNRIEIHCDPKNIVSAKIPATLGFKHETTLTGNTKDVEGNPRDTMIWTLSKEQYAQTPMKNFKIRVFDVRNVKVFEKTD